MNVYYEVRSTSKRVIYPPQLVTDVTGCTGFQSVYGYPDDTADVIRQQSGTFGLDGLSLYSDVLFLDFDNKPDSVIDAVAQQLSPYYYCQYNTGGRGYHFHVAIVPMLGPDIWQHQKTWVRKNFPAADLSLYKTSGVIRRPGTFHSKHPGQFKHLVRENSGDILNIPVSETTVRPMFHMEYCPEDPEYIREKTEILDNLLFKTVSEGTVGRNGHVFKIACVCRELGKSPGQAIAILEAWNTGYCQPPLKLTGLINTIQSAYRERRHA
jgi:hypothetical protein